MKSLGLGKGLAILAGLLTILGTWVFAMYSIGSFVGSGLGYIENLDYLISNAEGYATSLDLNIIVYWIIFGAFLIFLVSGVLQLLGVKSKTAIFVFSLFPLAVGSILMFLVYTDFLGTTSAFFSIFFHGEQFGGIYPILVPIGDLALGTYLLIGGGAVGIISAILPREEY